MYPSILLLHHAVTSEVLPTGYLPPRLPVFWEPVLPVEVFRPVRVPSFVWEEEEEEELLVFVEEEPCACVRVVPLACVREEAFC